MRPPDPARSHPRLPLRDPRTVRLFSFQALYAGLAPRRARALYAVIPYTDMVSEVFFPDGGTHRLPCALAELAERQGVTFAYGQRAERIEISLSGRARAVIAHDGERLPADAVVITAGPALAYPQLFGRTPGGCGLCGSSPSCFLLLAGAGRTGDALDHHAIHFGNSWRRGFEEIAREGRLMSAPSFLVSAPRSPTRAWRPQAATATTFSSPPHGADQRTAGGGTDHRPAPGRRVGTARPRGQSTGGVRTGLSPTTPDCPSRCPERGTSGHSSARRAGQDRRVQGESVVVPPGTPGEDETAGSGMPRTPQQVLDEIHRERAKVSFVDIGTFTRDVESILVGEDSAVDVEGLVAAARNLVGQGNDAAVLLALRRAVFARPATDFPGYDTWTGYFISEDVDGLSATYIWSSAALSAEWNGLDVSTAWAGEDPDDTVLVETVGELPVEPNAYDVDGDAPQPVQKNAYGVDGGAPQPVQKNAYGVDGGAPQPVQKNAYGVDGGAPQPVQTFSDDESGPDDEEIERERREAEKERLREERRREHKARYEDRLRELDDLKNLPEGSLAQQEEEDYQAAFKRGKTALGISPEREWAARSVGMKPSPDPSDDDESFDFNDGAASGVPTSDATRPMQGRYAASDLFSVIYFDLTKIDLGVVWDAETGLLKHGADGAAVADGKWGWVLAKGVFYLFTDSLEAITEDSDDPNVRKLKKEVGGELYGTDMNWKNLSTTKFDGFFKIRHSSFAPDEVTCAGMCEVTTDPATKVQKVTELDPCSGHFRPIEDNLTNAAEYLYKQGIVAPRTAKAKYGGGDRGGGPPGLQYRLPVENIALAAALVNNRDAEGSKVGKNRVIPHAPSIRRKKNLADSVDSNVKNFVRRNAERESKKLKRNVTAAPARTGAAPTPANSYTGDVGVVLAGPRGEVVLGVRDLAHLVEELDQTGFGKHQAAELRRMTTERQRTVLTQTSREVMEFDNRNGAPAVLTLRLDDAFLSENAQGFQQIPEGEPVAFVRHEGTGVTVLLPSTVHAPAARLVMFLRPEWSGTIAKRSRKVLGRTVRDRLDVVLPQGADQRAFSRYLRDTLGTKRIPRYSEWGAAERAPRSEGERPG